MINMPSQKITPFLWFDNKAAEAAAFYTSIFPDSKILSSRTDDNTPSGMVEVIELEISGQHFTFISAGPHFTINEAISFVITCEDQNEVDYFWGRLTGDGGEESMCGWCKDRFGVSWQVVPRRFHELIANSDKVAVGRVMQAMLQMRKLVIADLEKAYG